MPRPSWSAMPASMASKCCPVDVNPERVGLHDGGGPGPVPGAFPSAFRPPPRFVSAFVCFSGLAQDHAQRIVEARGDKAVSTCWTNSPGGPD